MLKGKRKFQEFVTKTRTSPMQVNNKFMLSCTDPVCKSPTLSFLLPSIKELRVVLKTGINLPACGTNKDATTPSLWFSLCLPYHEEELLPRVPWGVVSTQKCRNMTWPRRAWWLKTMPSIASLPRSEGNASIAAKGTLFAKWIHNGSVKSPWLPWLRAVLILPQFSQIKKTFIMDPI